MAGTIEVFNQAAELLGGERVLGRLPRDPVAAAQFIRRGIPARSIERLRVTFKLSVPDLAEALNLSGRTLERRTGRENAKSRLTATESERVYRFARVAARAIEVLGDMEKAYRWMRKENRALGSMQPMMLLDTDVGAAAVEDVLTRIEYGVPS